MCQYAIPRGRFENTNELENQGALITLLDEKHSVQKQGTFVAEFNGSSVISQNGHFLDP